MYLKSIYSKLVICLGVLYLPIYSRANNILNNSSYYLKQINQYDLIVNKYNPYLISILKQSKNQSFTYNIKKGILKYYISNPLGTGSMTIKHTNNIDLVRVELLGPKISFKENCGLNNAPLASLQEAGNIIKAEIEQKKLKPYYDTSCDKNKTIKNELFYDNFKKAFRDEGPSRCLENIDLINTFNELNPDKDLSILKVKFKQYNDRLLKSPESVQIACFSKFGDDVDQKTALLEDEALKDNKVISLFGFKIDNPDLNTKGCEDSVDYLVLHEMVHLLDKELKESDVNSVVTKCKEINKDSSKSCKNKGSDNSLQTKSCYLSTCGDHLDPVVERHLERRNEEAARSAVNSMSPSITEPIPESAIKAVSENPEGSPEFNKGMNIIASSMISKMNMASKVLEQAVYATAPDNNLNIPKISITNPNSTFKVWSKTEFESDKDIHPDINSNNENDITFNPEKNRSKDSMKNPNVGNIKNRSIGSLEAPKQLSKVLPMISNSLDFPDNTNSQTSNNVDTSNRKIETGKTNMALKHLVTFKKVGGEKYKIIKNAFATKDKNIVASLLKSWKISIVDPNNIILFNKIDKPNSPDLTFVDDGKSLKLAK